MIKIIAPYMSADLFERKFREAIEWQTEMLLGDGEFKDDEYDIAYEKAVLLVAEAEEIELV
jgi:hypothetical protein